MRKIIPVTKVAAAFNKNRSTIWRWATEERFAHLEFPKPVSAGPNSTGFFEDEVEGYQERIAAERAAQEPAEREAPPPLAPRAPSDPAQPRRRGRPRKATPAQTQTADQR